MFLEVEPSPWHVSWSAQPWLNHTKPAAVLRPNLFVPEVPLTKRSGLECSSVEEHVVRMCGSLDPKIHRNIQQNIEVNFLRKNIFCFVIWFRWWSCEPRLVVIGSLPFLRIKGIICALITFLWTFSFLNFLFCFFDICHKLEIKVCRGVYAQEKDAAQSHDSSV